MKRSNLHLLLLVGSVVTFLLLTNCRKESIFNDSSAQLNFSSDTILFDTVFTTVGSTFRRFTVRNPYNKKLIIDRIRLNGGTSSSFRINVDGIPTTDITDIEILPNDSIFIFSEVTVDPNNSLNPFVIEDKVTFTTNGNQQEVVLNAWGQNAYFHNNELICDINWQNDKPHVLYNTAAVGFPGLDSNCFLNIPDGTVIYAHNNARLIVYKSSLNINGIEGSEVLFRGDRLEAAYANAPGQWLGIRMIQPQNSVINHTTIVNGTYGIWVDTIDGADKVDINYTISGNHSLTSLWCRGTRVEAENSLFYSSAVHSAIFEFGGDYDFNHCTFSNYWVNSTRTTPLFRLNNYLVANNTAFHRPLVRANFNNCIIYGDKDNELEIDTIPMTTPNYIFNHNLLRTTLPTNNNHFNSISSLNPNFNGLGSSEFRLTSSSPRDNGDPLFPTTNGDDLAGEFRTAPSDIGCYEYIP